MSNPVSPATAGDSITPQGAVHLDGHAFGSNIASVRCAYRRKALHFFNGAGQTATQGSRIEAK